MKNQPFFIIGSKRGGTTLLRLMLNKNSALAIPPESHFILSLVTHFPKLQKPLSIEELQKAKKLVISHPRFNTWDIGIQQMDDIVSQLPQPYYLSSFINAIFNYKLKSYSKGRWGEKTPEYIDIIQQLNELFPDAQYIALIRDGRDVAISLKARGWEGWSIYQRSTYWKRCVQNINTLNAFGDNSILVKYEDLVTDTKDTLQKITTFLKVDFEQEMLQFNKDYSKNITEKEITSGVHTKLTRQPNAEEDIYRWKIQLSNNEIWRFESISHNELRMMGYEVSRFKADNIWHKLAKMGYQVTGEFIVLVHTIYHAIFPKTMKQKFRKNKMYNKFTAVIKET